MRQMITRLVAIGLMCFVEAHLVLIWKFGKVEIYEDRLWILLTEIALVGIFIILRSESYGRFLIEKFRKK